MVLGVDDFKQELLISQDAINGWARDLIGYGNGERTQRPNRKERQRSPRLIECGAALSPRGQLIRVTPAQCAYLNPWLAAQQRDAGRAGRTPRLAAR